MTNIFQTLKVVFITIILSGYLNGLMAQIPKGEWRDHLPYNTSHTVAIANDKVYCAAEHVMFYYDKDDNSLNRMSKSNGLSDLGIGSIAYSETYKSLVIGYSNGNLDVIKDGSKINICDIKDKNIIADKGIKHISIYDNKAYLSCGFGIVLLDIDRLEISDTYILGQNASFKPINATLIYGDSIFALTEDGILKADLDDPFLSYYEQWTKDTTLLSFSDNFISGTVFNNELFVSNKESSSLDSSLIQSYNGTAWNVAFDTLINVRSLSTSNEQLLIAYEWQVQAFNTNLEMVKHYGAAHSQHALEDKDGVMWIADEQKGLYRGGNSMYPNSPFSDKVFNITFNSDEILVAPGGYSRTGVSTYYSAEIYALENDEWSVINRYENAGMDTLRDIVCFAVQPGNSKRYYAGTWGKGLIEVEDNSVVGYYSENNTDSLLGKYIGGCTFDNNGNLWIVNRNREKPIVVKTSDDNWYSYSYDGLWSNLQTDKVIYTSDRNFWTNSIRGEGFFVWNSNGTPENGSDDSYIKRKLIDDGGVEIDDILNIIVEDVEGSIWVGTSDGIAVYDDPQDVFESTDFYARRPQIVVDNILRPLLEGENVTAIAVDGANRKWIGTLGGGLFLVSADGSEQILIFNSTNSPLLSDIIVSLELNQENGELFIGTDKGIMSYMTTSSESKASFSSIYAFPNPVKGSYDGLITVRGLMYETDVKITDLSGQLVYNTTSNGGDAVWNGRDLQGQLVNSGIYLVLCTNPDGSESEVSKIVVIR